MNRKIDFEGRDWAAHAQDHWLEFAGNPNFPDYLRVTFVAYGRHAANGHAKLDRGELSRFLVRRDGTLPDRGSVWSSVQKATTLGYLRPESKVLCLVVSSAHVQGGVGDPERPCRRDHTKRPKPRQAQIAARDEGGRIANVGDGDRRSVANVGGEGRRSSTNVGDDDRRSTLNPSLFSQPVRQDRIPSDGRRTA